MRGGTIGKLSSLCPIHGFWSHYKVIMPFHTTSTSRGMEGVCAIRKKNKYNYKSMAFIVSKMNGVIVDLIDTTSTPRSWGTTELNRKMSQHDQVLALSNT